MAKPGKNGAPKPRVVMFTVPLWDRARNRMNSVAADDGLRVNEWLNRLLCRELDLPELAEAVPRRRMVAKTKSRRRRESVTTTGGPRS